MDRTTARTNEEFNKVHVVMNKMADLYKEVNDAGGVQAVPLDAQGMDAPTRMQKLQEEMQKASFEFTKANMTNKAGEFLFYSSASSFTMDQLKELVALADSTFRNKPEIQALEKELNKVVPEVGKAFADVHLVDADGKPVALSSYVGKNKCVLLDFWASWCPPCIKEMPTLKKTYETYKSKGLEIVGISVDDDKQAWLNAVKNNKMDWVQLADDNKIASETYVVSSIPHTVLLDQNGVIVAKGLRGKELDDKIAEILK